MFGALERVLSQNFLQNYSSRRFLLPYQPNPEKPAFVEKIAGFCVSLLFYLSARPSFIMQNCKFG